MEWSGVEWSGPYPYSYYSYASGGRLASPLPRWWAYIGLTHALPCRRRSGTQTERAAAHQVPICENSVARDDNVS
jgi:hypothetical protein